VKVPPSAGWKASLSGLADPGISTGAITLNDAKREIGLLRWKSVVAGDYRGLFVVIATSAATLIGLLFVAVSVSKGRSQAHPQLVREFRAAAALFAFTNPFAVSIFGLVPGTNIGYPAAILGVIGVAFAAAGVRVTFSLPATLGHRREQVTLIFALLLLFGLQILFGIVLLIRPDGVGALADIGYVLVASLLIGIGRAWELVGAWDTGLFTSLGLFFGLQPAQRKVTNHEPESTDSLSEPESAGE
jgi:hypothetical protein